MKLTSAGMIGFNEANSIMSDDEGLMMIKFSQEEELPAKQGSASDDKARTSSTRLWSGLKDPRIVRVSRAFGGKDRHSKVTTIRGLRDRRVRLSVPTAIQLYDLQDRLGLNQPSKVIDWLLSAAQHEIDKLPPLQMPPGNFLQFPQSLQISHEPIENLQSTTESGARPLALFSSRAEHDVLGDEVVVEDLATLSKSNCWHSDVPQKNKQREEPMEAGIGKGSNVKGDGTEDYIGTHCAQVSANDSLSRPHHSSLGFLSNAMPYTSYYQWEPANANVSHLGVHSSPIDGPPPLNPSSLSLTPSSQLVFCPPGAVPPVFDFDPKQFNHFQVVSSASQNAPLNSTRVSLHSGSPAVSPFQSYLASKHHHSGNQNES